MTKEECLRTHNDEEMMRHHEWWPLGDILPLKRSWPRRFGSGLPDIGFLRKHEEPPRENVSVIVWVGHFGTDPADDTKCEMFQTAEDATGAGWVVD